jgi:hypothetical protein
MESYKYNGLPRILSHNIEDTQKANLNGEINLGGLIEALRDYAKEGDTQYQAEDREDLETERGAYNFGEEETDTDSELYFLGNNSYCE